MNTLKTIALFIVTLILIGCSTESEVDEYEFLLDRSWELTDYVIHDPTIVEEQNISFDSINSENSILRFEKSDNQVKLRITTIRCGEMLMDVDFQNEKMILSNRQILRNVEEWQYCATIGDQRSSLTSLIVLYMYSSELEDNPGIIGEFEYRNDELFIYFSREEQELERLGPVTLIFG